ncbi:related to peptidyl-prolyl cis-trans isomerase (FKBP-type) [Desulfotalea psychrophila LSv54]|uniref:Peptidyl-prolyl cis-trans isomerase n=2 Tax=Desulfotalea psychrophila TaxID=84980 RepID=Q6AII6_DESPS|nr:related to peptidyl-prolyl cis-trans isomerase (FKBP-type) [Desulfotalea psychrophila LSv54]
MAGVKKGDKVKVRYVGKLQDGTVFDSSEGKEPLAFKVGSGDVIDGFDEAMLGMAVGETKEVHIPIAKAYGERNEEMMMDVPVEQIPDDLGPELGMRLEVGAPDGGVLRVVVVELDEKHMLLDANPPLAGKDLDFSLELVEISA